MEWQDILRLVRWKWVSNMANQEILLTNELYESIRQSLINEVVDLKKAQGDAISNLDIQIEMLKSLKKQLKSIKRDIRSTKRKIHENKSRLSSINEKLNQKNHIVIDLNYSFITECDSYINTESFPSLKGNTKKR